MSDAFVRVEKRDELAVVVIDRQDKLNALNADVVRELGAAVRVGLEARRGADPPVLAGERRHARGRGAGLQAEPCKSAANRRSGSFHKLCVYHLPFNANCGKYSWHPI